MTFAGFPRIAATAGFLALCSMPFQSVAARPADAAKVPGDLWEVTSRMSMEGMPMEMPSQKSQICAPKDWKEPPAAADERQKCRNTDFKVEGTKATWKVVCAGPPEMSGQGEIVRDGAEAYEGAIKLTSTEARMTIKLSGKRLGPCEATPK